MDTETLVLSREEQLQHMAAAKRVRNMLQFAEIAHEVVMGNIVTGQPLIGDYPVNISDLYVIGIYITTDEGEEKWLVRHKLYV